MGKMILEVEIKVSRKVHKKKTKGGITEYRYGSISIDNPLLFPHVGKTVWVRIEHHHKNKEK